MKKLTLANYLKSREFKREYGCWYGAFKLYDLSGELIDMDYYELYDDDKWEEFSNSHYVMNVEQGWELDDSHESCAFAMIILNIEPEISHKPIDGYFYVEFYDDNGNCKNHWFNEAQTYYFKNRDDAVKHIETVRGWHAISFTQTLIKQVR